MDKDFWNKEYDDICDGVLFKFKKPNSVEFVNLITKDIDTNNMSLTETEKFINRCLSYALWTKDGSAWHPVINDDGTARLPEMDTNPSIALDLFYKFKGDVLTPVFTESKTYQSFIQGLKKQNKDK